MFLRIALTTQMFGMILCTFFIVSCLPLSVLFSQQVALYTRRELNIRTTANFLLAYSSNQPSCRPYLQKYFKAAVCLPSDWIEVAEIYQVCQHCYS